MDGKQILTCIHERMRALLSKDGGKLLDAYVKTIKDWSAVPLVFEDLMVKYPARPIRFINFKDFCRLGHLPRFPDNENITCSLESIDRNKSFLVFISHCWLRGHPGTEGWDGKAHPDNANNDKFKLCAEGIKQLKDSQAPRMKECYIWIDFGCMNQDDKEKMTEELEHYDRIIQYCDCLFTPIHDPDHLSWGISSGYYDDFELCLCQSWNVGEHAYLNRAWCRVEMMCAALLPVVQDNDTMDRSSKFEAGLAFHCSQNRRPHFLYETNDVKWHFPPFVLPPLKYSYFQVYNPLKGCLSVADDIYYVRILVGELMKYNAVQNIQLRYTGDKNHRGQRHGYGVMVYSNGSGYKGQWVQGKRSGQGNFRFTNGDEYDGAWKRNKRQGYGILRYASGAMYAGQWKVDKVHGYGTMWYARGAVYKGQWKGNRKHGFGYYQSEDARFKGYWNYGKRLVNGVVMEQQWEADREHDRSTLFYHDFLNLEQKKDILEALMENRHIYCRLLQNSAHTSPAEVNLTKSSDSILELPLKLSFARPRLMMLAKVNLFIALLLFILVISVPPTLVDGIPLTK